MLCVRRGTRPDIPNTVGKNLEGDSWVIVLKGYNNKFTIISSNTPPLPMPHPRPPDSTQRLLSQHRLTPFQFRGRSIQINNP
jgi:hypothetical protein